MTQNFERGVYCHKLTHCGDVDRVTYLGSNLEELEAFKKKHPRVQIAVDASKKLSCKEVTLMASSGMHLEKEAHQWLVEGCHVRIALPSSIELLKNLHIEKLSAQNILIDLMAFDYIRPSTGCRTNFHSLLFAWDGPCVLRTVEFLHSKGIPLKKVNLGLASFGIKFKQAHPGLLSAGYGQLCEGEQLDNSEMSSEEIQAYLQKFSSARLFYTSFLGCYQSFIYNSENGDWISFDDDKTLQAKVAWARSQGFHGVFLH